MSDEWIDEVPDDDLNKDFREGLMGYYKSGIYSDFIIRCSQTEYKVHKIIICSQSDVFRAACRDKFKEGLAGVYDLSEHHPTVVQALIDAMYGLDYNDGVEFTGGEASPLLLNAEVYALAEKYQVRAIKRLAAIKFETFAIEHWNRRCFEIFPAAVKRIYETTAKSDRDLRGRLVRFTADNVGVLFMVDRGFKRMTEEVGEFASDLAEHMGHCQECPIPFMCPNCAEAWNGYTFADYKGMCPHCGVFRDDWNQHMSICAKDDKSGQPKRDFS